MNLDDVVTQVAAAVGLAEGESGIRDILAAVLAAEPGAVREIARLAELPVPIVAAASNELPTGPRRAGHRGARPADPRRPGCCRGQCRPRPGPCRAGGPDRTGRTAASCRGWRTRCQDRTGPDALHGADEGSPRAAAARCPR